MQQLRRTAIGLDEEIRQKYAQLGEARKAHEVVQGQVDQTKLDVENMTKHRNKVVEDLNGLQGGVAVIKSGADQLGAIAGSHRAEGVSEDIDRERPTYLGTCWHANHLWRRRMSLVDRLVESAAPHRDSSLLYDDDHPFN